MKHRHEQISLRNTLMLVGILLAGIAIKYGFISDAKWYGLLIIAIPLWVMAIVVFPGKTLP